jgi:hypothetical protein
MGVLLWGCLGLASESQAQFTYLINADNTVTITGYTELNQFGFTIAATNSFAVAIDGCTNLPHPDWRPLQTNTLPGGPWYFSDPQWANFPSRFYRLRMP